MPWQGSSKWLYPATSPLRNKIRQVVTIVLPTADSRVLKVRRAAGPTLEQIELYAKLNVPYESIRPKKIWL